jgi:cytidine deaminase
MSPESLAVKTASESRHPRYKLGAVLYHGKHGFITAKANLVRGLDAPGICAEERVLRNLPRCAMGGNRVMYVARVLRLDGSASMAKPCSKCQRLLARAGIKKVYYTNWDGNWQKMSIS